MAKYQLEDVLKYGPYKFSDSFYTMKRTIFRNLYLKIAIIVLMTIMFTTVVSCLSIFLTSAKQEYLQIFKEYDSYIMPIVNKSQNQDVSSEDIEYVKEKLNRQIPVYSSYLFIKNFNDFIDYENHFNSTDKVSYPYITSSIKEIILVDSFGNFHEPLIYGHFPTTKEEVLIYDYLANQLLRTEKFDNITEINQLIGYTLTDKDTNLKLTISGILKSRYDDFLICERSIGCGSDFQEAYYGKLLSIFAHTKFLSELTKEQDYFSINNISFLNTVDQTEFEDNDFRKVKTVNTLDNFTFIANPIDNEGILLSKHQYADIVGIEVDQVTIDVINSKNLTFETFFYEVSQNENLPKRSRKEGVVLGVYESTSLDENILFFYQKEDNAFSLKNSTVNKLYISLTDNWKKNNDIITLFNKADNEFKETTSYSLVLKNMNQYKEDIFSLNLFVSLCITVVVIFLLSGYSFYIMKKNHYVFETIKNMDAKSIFVYFVFYWEFLLLSFVSVVLSLIPSLILIGFFNIGFEKVYSYSIEVFRLSFGAILIGFVGFMIVLLALSYLVLKRKIDIIPKRKIS